MPSRGPLLSQVRARVRQNLNERDRASVCIQRIARGRHARRVAAAALGSPRMPPPPPRFASAPGLLAQTAILGGASARSGSGEVHI